MTVIGRETVAETAAGDAPDHEAGHEAVIERLNTHGDSRICSNATFTDMYSAIKLAFRGPAV